MKIMFKHTCLVVLALCLVSLAMAYPLDGREGSGIRRLTGYQFAQTLPQGPKVAPGGLLDTKDISLTLVHQQVGPDFDELPVEPELQKSLESIFKSRDPSYSAVVIDISKPEDIAWAAIQPDIRQNAGSVGKILTMLALFDSLARTFPEVNDRERVLRDSNIYAGNWVISDHHGVPKFSEQSGTNQSSIIETTDNFQLSEWMDHMISASANAAGSVVWREAMLLRKFGNAYPLSPEASEQFFNDTPKTQLGALSLQVINEPLLAAKLNHDNFRQGSFWTSTGQARIPGTRSFATARELARHLWRMEQGRLIDAWSSLEMKRYLYMTKRRYRYVYAPELAQSAVFFKSGSLYQCEKEEGFTCGKYMGNVRNMMNSVVVVESLPGAAQYYRYIVALMSNVLKINSAWDHSRLGAAIHEAVLTRGVVKVKEEGDRQNIQDAGKS
ncbi:MAG: hypothetical protein ACI909_003874 [Planctomycetota bacterium]|jgi:hypothetical protein